MKHASGQMTHVLVHHREEHVEIKVTTDAPAASPVTLPVTQRRGPAGGRGLAGLRARVSMLDGELDAGPRPEGGFEVRATIPSKPVQE